MSPLLLVVIQHQDRLFWCSLRLVGLERGLGTDAFLLGDWGVIKIKYRHVASSLFHIVK